MMPDQTGRFDARNIIQTEEENIISSRPDEVGEEEDGGGSIENEGVPEKRGESEERGEAVMGGRCQQRAGMENVNNNKVNMYRYPSLEQERMG